jgi:hypothetical protein
VLSLAKKIVAASSTKAAADLEFPASLVTATSDTAFLRTEEDRGDGIRGGVRGDGIHGGVRGDAGAGGLLLWRAAPRCDGRRRQRHAAAARGRRRRVYSVQRRHRLLFLSGVEPLYAVPSGDGISGDGILRSTR